jgi:hypothetical protein
MTEVTITVLKVRETAAAVLVDPDGDGETQVWIPLSRVHALEPRSDGLHDLTVDEKLATEKGLV